MSQIKSTAAFDENPQSRERGITIDLGFSAFQLTDHCRCTFVDCPGHASLIRTVLCGINIIQASILVIDVIKGIQAQTLDCIILAEVFRIPVIIVLNKTDLVPIEQLDSIIMEQEAKIRKLLSKTSLVVHSIIPFSTFHDTDKYKAKLSTALAYLSNECSIIKKPNDPLLIAIDHVFGIKGKGTILTGTVLSGKLLDSEKIQILSGSTPLLRKIKSIQSFRVSVKEACVGDRIAINVADLDPSQHERCLVVGPNPVVMRSRVFANVKRISHYQKICESRSQVHGTVENTFQLILLVTIFHETILAKVTFFRRSSESDYEIAVNLDNDALLAMFEFSRPILFIPGTNVLASKLDLDMSLKTCKFIFSGTIIPEPTNFSVIKWKSKTAEIDRIQDENTLIGKNLVGHPSGILAFIGKPVQVKRKDVDGGLCTGVIKDSFGTSGKFKIILDHSSPEALSMRPSELEVFLTFKNRVKL